jgi:hypothetical protein
MPQYLSSGRASVIGTYLTLSEIEDGGVPKVIVVLVIVIVALSVFPCDERLSATVGTKLVADTVPSVRPIGPSPRIPSLQDQKVSLSSVLRVFESSKWLHSRNQNFLRVGEAFTFGGNSNKLLRDLHAAHQPSIRVFRATEFTTAI